MEEIVHVLYNVLNSYAFLMISAMGLAIIFGMMGIINLAHGDFIMMGAYITTLTVTSGVPLVIGIILGAVGMGLFGLLMDRILMSRLYNRPIDSIVVTWGLSAIIQQATLMIFGPALPVFSIPLGTVAYGKYTYPVYRLVLIAVGIALPIALYLIFKKTRFGLESRATMQRPDSASMLGTNRRRMYSLTFMLGSAFAGLAGGLYACTMAMVPTTGQNFHNQSMLTVIVGGSDPLIGTVGAAGVLSLVESPLSLLYGSFIGRMGLLIAAIIVLRVLPGGVSGFVDRARAEYMRKKGSV